MTAESEQLPRRGAVADQLDLRRAVHVGHGEDAVRLDRLKGQQIDLTDSAGWEQFACGGAEPAPFAVVPPDAEEDCVAVAVDEYETRPLVLREALVDCAELPQICPGCPCPHRDPLREERFGHEQIPGISGIYVGKELNVAGMRLVEVDLLGHRGDLQWIGGSDVLALQRPVVAELHQLALLTLSDRGVREEEVHGAVLQAMRAGQALMVVLTLEWPRAAVLLLCVKVKARAQRPGGRERGGPLGQRALRRMRLRILRLGHAPLPSSPS